MKQQEYSSTTPVYSIMFNCVFMEPSDNSTRSLEMICMYLQ